MERSRDNQGRHRKGLSQFHQVLRSLIVVRYKTGYHEIEFGSWGFRPGCLQVGTVSNEVFHPRQSQLDEAFEVGVGIHKDIGHNPQSSDGGGMGMDSATLIARLQERSVWKASDPINGFSPAHHGASDELLIQGIPHQFSRRFQAKLGE